MIPLNLTLDVSNGVTLLSNVFIDQYMKDANDTQIKVYLYLLRMISANLPTDISEIADKFNDSEKDIIRALKYWEKLHLLTIEYNRNDEVTGIHFTDANNLNKNNCCEVISDSLCNNSKSSELTTTAPILNAVPALEVAPISEIAPVSKVAPVSEVAPVSDIVFNKSSERKITMVTMDYEKAKQAYSIKDIQKITSDQHAKMLLLVSERYFERPLNPDEIKSLLFIYDRLNFKFELCDYLIEYCIGQNQRSIRYIEQIAYGWYEAGIQTPKQAMTYAKKQDINVYAIMSYLGKSGTPADKELAFIRRWMNTYAFSLSIIEDACGRAVLATDHHRFEYAESILKSWYDNNVRTKSDIAKLDQAFENNKKAKETAKEYAKNTSKEYTKKAAVSTNITNSNSNSQFCNIESRDYDFAALEDALTKKKPVNE